MQYAKYFKPAFLMRIETTTDDWGAPVEMLVPVREVMGRMRQLSASEQHVSGNDNVVSTHRFYCDAIDIRNEDVIMYVDYEISWDDVITAWSETGFVWDEAHKEMAYRVIRPNNVMTFSRLMQVDCEVIET